MEQSSNNVLRITRRAADRLRTQVSDIRVRADSGEWITVTVSVGVSELSVTGGDLHRLLDAADTALYAADGPFPNFLIKSISRSAAMPREGTRSQTGHSKPRIFPTVDTAPTITRKKPAKAKKAPAVKGTKPTGVAKKKAAPKKEPGAAVKKVKAPVKKAVKKAEAKAEKPEKEAKPKTTKKKEPVAK